MEFFKNFYKEDKIVGLCAFKKKKSISFKSTASTKYDASSFFGDGRFNPNMFR